MRKALIIGINYEGTGYDLKGCINDAHTVEDYVRRVKPFDEVKLLLEKEATTAGILAGMEWLVSGARPGDVLLMHYSGHGSQARSIIEPDGLDEIICPIDIDWREKIIRDDQMKAILSKVPNGVNLTVVLDCCHSGDGLDLGATMALEEVLNTVDRSAALAGGETRWLAPPEVVQQEINEEGLKVREFKTSRDINRCAVLIAACRSNQTAADAMISGKFQGAATHALYNVALFEGAKTNADIVRQMNFYMGGYGFDQRPQLDGHPSLYEQIFLETLGTAPETAPEVPPPGVWKEPKKVGDGSMLGFTIGAMSLAAILWILFI